MDHRIVLRFLRRHIGELLVEVEEVGDAVGVRFEGLLVVEAIDKAVDSIFGRRRD